MSEPRPWRSAVEDPTVQPRRFRILGVLGRGGFGTVYRARMERPDGFAKIVALKRMNDDVPPAMLQRFRDEARVLGLVSDRAVVGVEPPTSLDGRWVMVMECVDGASAQALASHGPFPPRVAVAVVQEIARALDKVYHQPGPDDGPLRLIHRDLKPANVHLTADGDVKLLDFGIARASFPAREATTTAHVAGTPGYIAPERLAGREGPEADVFSLGVMLHVLVTGEPATEVAQSAAATAHQDAGVRAALALAEQMRHPDPERRPTAREVEERCRSLVEAISGPSLPDWARVRVPEARTAGEDDLVGAVLHETLAVPTASGRTGAPVVLGGVVGLAGLAVGVAALLVAVVLVVGAWTLRRPSDEVLAPISEVPDRSPERTAAALPADRDREPAAGTGGAEVAPVPDADPGTAPPPDPPRRGGAARRTRPEPAPRAARPSPAASPSPSPAPAPAAAPEIVRVTLLSEPSGAEVFVDEVLVGTTPIRGLPVPRGSHRLRFMAAGGHAIAREVDIGGRRGATEFTWVDGELVAR